MLADLHAYVDANAEGFLEELCDFVRQPSQTGLLENVRAGARYTKALAERSGWQAEVVEVGELAPIVVAERPGPPGSKTLLLCSHYDVISPEPVDQWTYPPYSATRIYGRGATDAKANVLSFLKAGQSFGATRGTPPVSLKLILEGEEERGNGNLHEFMDRQAGRLQADAAVSGVNRAEGHRLMDTLDIKSEAPAGATVVCAASPPHQGDVWGPITCFWCGKVVYYCLWCELHTDLEGACCAGPATPNGTVWYPDGTVHLPSNTSACAD